MRINNKILQKIKKFQKNLIKVFDRYFPPAAGYFLSWSTSRSFRLSSLAAEFYINQTVLDKFILYESNNGKEFSGNPYGLFNYLLDHKDFQKFTHVIAVSDKNYPTIAKYRNHNRVIIVKIDSYDYVKYAESCKYFINNFLWKPYLIKQNYQIFIYTVQDNLFGKMSSVKERTPEATKVSGALLAADFIISPNKRITEIIFNSSYALSLAKCKIAEFEFQKDNELSVYQRTLDLVFNGKVDNFVYSLPEDKRKKILIYPGAMNPNGVTTSFLSLLDSLDYNKYDITVFINDSDKNWNFQKKICKKANVYYQDVDNAFTYDDYKKAAGFRRKGAFSSLDIPVSGYERTMRRVFYDRSFDIVINYHGYHPGDAAKLSFGIKSDCKIIYLHNDLEKDRKIKQPQLHSVFSLYKFFDKLFCVSSDSLEANLNGMALYTKNTFNDDITLKMDYINNMISPKELHNSGQADIKYQFQLPDKNEISFLTIGRLSPEKNQLRLLQAFYKVYKKYPQALLYIAGTGKSKYRQKLQKTVKRFGLGKNIIFTGFLKNPYPLMKACDCFVLSSDIEGQPITILEALTLGKPIISTDIAGPHNQLKDGYGKLVEPNAESLAQGMIDFIGNGRKMERISFNAEAYVLEVKEEFEHKVLGIVK